MADAHSNPGADETHGTVRFVLDGRIVAVKGVPATTTVLDYLREDLGRTGTKEGCAEGDCGACTVLLGELNADDKIEYRAVNSCIRFLPTIDGQELVTVEGLQAADGTLHPVQQAMVDEHASQCGFCTPGFVMSLFALYLNVEKPEREQVVDALAGNLCRCTGYRPIIDAGCRMSSYPVPQRWSRADAHDRARVEKLKKLRRTEALVTTDFIAPRTTDEFAAIRQARLDALVLAGGTDIGLWVTKQLRQLPTLLYVGAVRELRSVRRTNEAIEIGAAVTLTEAWQAITAVYPQLADLAHRFASPPVCNSGTLCGNVANGSPVGDSMPALIALGAHVDLRLGAQRRHLPLEDFYLGYQKKDLQPGEFVASVSVPLPRAGQFIASYKVSKRFDQDIAAVCAAFAIEFEGEIVRTARIAFGGMAAIASRAKHAEAALTGQRWTLQALERAAQELSKDFQPLSDMRASSDYRLQAAKNTLLRCFHDRDGKLTSLSQLHAPVTA